MIFATGCFLWPSVCRSFPWSQLCRILETARWGSPWQIWHSSASRALWEPRFAAKCFARLALYGNRNYDMMAFAPMCFCGLLFAGVSPGRNFAEFQKTRAEGLLGKFDIARLRGHFGSRSLQQNVVVGWHFKEILITTWWHSRQGVFVAFFLQEFPLVATLQNFRKRALRVSLANLT